MQTYKFSQGEHGDPFTHPNTWAREDAKGVPRLRVAAACHQVALIELLMEQMSTPFYLLYVLVVSRTGTDPARFQLQGVQSEEQVREFLHMSRDAFERDARHSLWIKSAEGPDLLVYDRHNLLYLYGPLDAFEEVLQRAGLQQRDKITLPDPHGHHYWPDYDGFEQSIVASGNWNETPLRPQDTE